MSFTKRPREETTVTYQGRRVIVDFYTLLESSRKRFRVNFHANKGPKQRATVTQRDEHHDTLSEEEVQAAVLAHLRKRPLALPEEATDSDTCAVDAEGGEGEQGTRVCDSVCECILCMVGAWCVCSHTVPSPPPLGLRVGAGARRVQPKRENTERDFFDPPRPHMGASCNPACRSKTGASSTSTATISKLVSSNDGDIRKFLTKLSKRTRIPENVLEPFVDTRRRVEEQLQLRLEPLDSAVRAAIAKLPESADDDHGSAQQVFDCVRGELEPCAAHDSNRAPPSTASGSSAASASGASVGTKWGSRTTTCSQTWRTAGRRPLSSSSREAQRSRRCW